MSKILIDSGAYSSWTLGGEIDLNKYVQFIKRNKQYISLYVSLDVIPGSDGRRTSDPFTLERAAQRTYRNHLYMKDAGLTPIPVFHQDDDFKWLEQYLADGEKYIALAPHGMHPHNIIPWLDECYRVIEKSAIQPRVKIHALGVTTSVLMRRYSFASVDSNTWAQHAGHGQILTPIYVGGQPDYSLRPRSVAVSNRSSMRRNHIDRLSPFRRKQVKRFLNEQVRMDLANLRTDRPAGRWRANIVYFKGLAASCNTEIFFVTSTNTSQRDTLLDCDAHSHLLSYYRMQNQPYALENYMNKHTS